MKQILIVGILLIFGLTGVAQDKSYLARVEYEMAEEALAVKEHSKVTEHLEKAIEYLGESNLKIDYLSMLNLYEITHDPSIKETEKELSYLNFYNSAGLFLKTYANTTVKEKYAEVYRLRREIEPKATELKTKYSKLYASFMDYHRTVDSLKFFDKTNWLETKRGIDSVWTLGRSYNAITGRFKKSVVKKLYEAKSPFMPSKEFFSFNVDLHTFYELKGGFVINDVHMLLPDYGAIVFSHEWVSPIKVVFNRSNRLVAVKYAGMRGSKLEEPVENAWSWEMGSKGYVTGASHIITYFSNETDTGIWIFLPHDRMEGGDADGNGGTPVLLKPIVSPKLTDKVYFRMVYGHFPGIQLEGKDVTGHTSGGLVTKVTPGGSAEAAGLKENDIITRIGYRMISSFSDVIDAVFLYRPGEVVEVEYSRNGTVRKTQVVVGKL